MCLQCMEEKNITFHLIYGKPNPLRNERYYSLTKSALNSQRDAALYFVRLRPKGLKVIIFPTRPHLSFQLGKLQFELVVEDGLKQSFRCVLKMNLRYLYSFTTSIRIISPTLKTLRPSLIFWLKISTFVFDRLTINISIDMFRDVLHVMLHADSV